MAADHEVGSLRTEFEDADFDAVGRAPFDGPAAAAVAVIDFFTDERPQESDGVADATLFGGGGDDIDFAQRLQFALHRREARGVDAVVVGEEDSHGGSEW